MKSAGRPSSGSRRIELSTNIREVSQWPEKATLVSWGLLRALCEGSLTALIQDKYENIHVQSCGKKMCTACEIANRFDSTITVNLRGLCRYTYLDTEYQVILGSDWWTAA